MPKRWEAESLDIYQEFMVFGGNENTKIWGSCLQPSSVCLEFPDQSTENKCLNIRKVRDRNLIHPTLTPGETGFWGRILKVNWG